MTGTIEKVNPPGRSKKNRGSIFRVIGRIGDIVSSDISKVSRAFFPYLCDDDMLTRHSVALGIPQFPGESREALRERASTGAKWMENRGLRGSLYDILNKVVPNRYDVFEAPKNSFRVGFSRIGIDRIGEGFFIVIKIRSLTSDDYNLLFPILDDVLDPDIEIIIIPWISAQMENLTLEQIRLYGGSKWLASLYSDICFLDVRILPDDAFTVGSGRVGYSVIYPSGAQPKIMILCDSDFIQSVTERTQILLNESIQWEVRTNG